MAARLGGAHLNVTNRESVSPDPAAISFVVLPPGASHIVSCLLILLHATAGARTHARRPPPSLQQVLGTEPRLWMWPSQICPLAAVSSAPLCTDAGMSASHAGFMRASRRNMPLLAGRTVVSRYDLSTIRKDTEDCDGRTSTYPETETAMCASQTPTDSDGRSSTAAGGDVCPLRGMQGCRDVLSEAGGQRRRRDA